MKEQWLAARVAPRWPEELPRLAAAECPEPVGWRRWWRGFYRFMYDFNRY